jgi:hypothetical protein
MPDRKVAFSLLLTVRSAALARQYETTATVIALL